MEKRFHFLKRTVSIIMALVAVICFSGCVRYSLTAKVDKDGTVDIVFIYAMMKDYATDIDETEQNMRDTMDDTGLDYELDNYDEDEYVGFVVTVLDVPIDELEEVLVDKMEMEGIEVLEDDGVYTINWDVSSVTDEASGSGISSDTLKTYGGYMRFSIELPSPAISDNADEVSGTKYSWDLMEVDEKISISFQLKGAFAFPYSTKVTINKDRTADLEVLIAAVEEEDDALEDRIGIFEDNDWEITEEEGKKVTGIFGELKHLEIEEIGEELEALGIGYDGFTVEFDEDEGLYTIDWDAVPVAQRADTSEVSSSAKKDFGKYMTFILELPNAAEDENATEADGKILTWELLEMDEEVHAEFKIKKSGFPMWVIGVIIGGVIIVAGIIVMIVILSKRKKTPKDPAPVNSPVSPAPSYIPQPTSSAIPVGTPSPSNPTAPPAPQLTGFPQMSGLPVVGMPSQSESAQTNPDSQLPPGQV